MTEERFDIEITDKISPGISAKLKAIARDALDADTAVSRLRKDLSALQVGGVDRVSAAFRRARAATQEDAIAKARAAQAAKTAQYEFNKLLGVNQRLEKSARASAAAFKDLLGAQERSAAAAKTTGPILQNRPVNVSTAPTRQAQYRAQNLFYQIQDIGVSLGSGQRASTVLLQQGSQILGIYGASGGLRAGLAQLRGDFARLVPPQALAALAALAGGLLLFQREIKKTTGVSVSFGNIFVGLFTTIKQEIAQLFKPISKEVSVALDVVYVVLKSFAKLVFTALTAPFVAGYGVIVTTFKNLPHALGELFIEALNQVIRIVENGINRIVAGINVVNGPLNAVAKKLGGEGNIRVIDPVDLGRIENNFTHMKALANDTGEAFADAFDTGRAERFAAKWQTNSVSAQLKDNAEAAKKAKKELSDYEKLVQELNAPLIELAKTLPLLNLAFQKGDITLEMKTRKLRELRIAVLELSSDLDSGLKLGLLRVEEQFTNVADVASKLVVNAFQSAEDALVSFVTKGKLDVKSLVDSIAADFARLAIRQSITGPLAGMLGQIGGSASSFGGSVLNGLSSILPSFDVGTSYVPRDMIAQIHKGERIVPASQNTAMRSSSGSSSFNVTNSININWTSSGAANDNQVQAEKLAQEMQRQLDQSMQRYVDKQKRIGGQLNAGNVVA